MFEIGQKTKILNVSFLVTKEITEWLLASNLHCRFLNSGVINLTPSRGRVFVFWSDSKLDFRISRFKSHFATDSLAGITLRVCQCYRFKSQKQCSNVSKVK